MEIAMDFSVRPVHPVPPSIPDLRPAADAAAIVREPRPVLSLPIPPGQPFPGLAQSAVLAMADRGEARVSELPALVRVLKPYGITILPDDAARREAAAEIRDGARQAAQKTADTAQSERSANTADTMGTADPTDMRRRAETGGTAGGVGTEGTEDTEGRPDPAGR